MILVSRYVHVEDSHWELHLCLRRSMKSYPCLCFPGRCLSPVCFHSRRKQQVWKTINTCGLHQLQGCFTHMLLHRGKTNPILSVQWFHLKTEYLVLPWKISSVRLSSQLVTDAHFSQNTGKAEWEGTGCAKVSRSSMVWRTKHYLRVQKGRQGVQPSRETVLTNWGKNGLQKKNVPNPSPQCATGRKLEGSRKKPSLIKLERQRKPEGAVGEKRKELWASKRAWLCSI